MFNFKEVESAVKVQEKNWILVKKNEKSIHSGKDS